MSTEHQFDEKGKVRPKQVQETQDQEKENPPLTRSQIEGGLDGPTLTQMQQTMGNAAVQRVLAQRSGQNQSDVDDETAASIESQRGGGHGIDQEMASRAGQTMGHQLGDVNVHTDGTADQLSRQLGAQAFTTGNDIFFRRGAYDPGSSDGQHLIAHELTHVVQQGAATTPIQGKLTVNEPDDQYETEANQVADTVMSQEEEELQLMRQEEEELQLMRQEEEEEVMMQPIEEEEEELQP